jgi:putative membrane protein
MIQQRFLILLSSICVLAVVLAVGCSSAKDSSKFAANAAQGGMAEVEMGRLASEKAQNAAVKEFGQRMVADHSRANEELKGAASKKGIQLPADLNSHQKSEMEKLSKLSGPDFDKAYMSAMLKDHEEDVKAFQTQANQGTDPEIKAFAAKALPTLQAHLQLARDTAKRVGAD